MRKNKLEIRENDTILFIGDSITDVGRSRTLDADLGRGFPHLIAAELLKQYPEDELSILNRGISGNTLAELKNRWEEDCLNLTPDLVTILIGINDVYQAMEKNKSPKDEELEAFEKNYRYLLKSLAQQTDARVIIMEPFLLSYPKDRINWREQLDPRIQIIRRIAKDYHALFIPLDGLLNAKGIAHDYKLYTGDDGIHPTLLGHATIKDAWFDYLGL